MAPGRSVVLPVLTSAALLLASGCGSGSSHTANGARHRRASANASGGGLPNSGTATIPAPAPTGSQPNPGAVKVIVAWSNALRRGDLRTAAGYFRIPSELINGAATNGSVLVIRIHDFAQAEAANATLPCGARFISADQRGRYVNALFRLTGRPGPGGSSCGSGTGQTARTNFLIANGRIVEWIRAPDDPGDNGSPTSPPGSGGGAPAV